MRTQPFVTPVTRKRRSYGRVSITLLVVFGSSRSRTMRVVRQNLAWAFGYNLLMLPLAAGVLASIGDVPLRMLSQAASRRNSTFVIRESDLPAALGRIHDKFFSEVIA